MIAFALASSLFLQDPAATAAPSAAPPPSTMAAPVADAPPKRPEPRWKGTGLLATTGVLAGTGLAVTIARSVLLKKNCPLGDAMGAAQCTYDFGSDIGLAATQWTVNLATVGFAPAAGVMLGRHHAWKDTQVDRTRPIPVLMGTGGGLLGLGIAGVGTSIALAFVLPARCLDKELESGDPLAGDRCLLKSFPAWTMTNWASFAMIGSGAAMIGYGNAYRKSRPARMARVQVSPFAGRTHAGVGVGGQF